MVGGAVVGGGVGMRIGGDGKAASNGDGTGAAAATPEEQAADPVTLAPVSSGPVNGIPCSMRRIREAGMRYSRRAAGRRPTRRVVGVRGMLGHGKV
ncbi:MAG: hypothetical protein GY832_27515 [Chloroflexi bacterium]|nr:hypothetical protein [Chloroflexota bacterium]